MACPWKFIRSTPAARSLKVRPLVRLCFIAALCANCLVTFFHWADNQKIRVWYHVNDLPGTPENLTQKGDVRASRLMASWMLATLTKAASVSARFS
jgi:hypothetical protein